MHDGLLKKGWSYTLSINDNNIISKIGIYYVVVCYNIFWFLVTFALCINQVLVLNSFSFLFLQNSLFIELKFLCLMTCLSLKFSVVLKSTTFRIFFLYFFRCCECWLSWIRLRFHYRKHRELLVKPWPMECTVYKIKLTSWKTFTRFKHLLVCSLASTINIFSKAHDMSCFQTGINISHVMFLQCVWIKSHSSSLTNTENLTSSFC